MANVQELIGRLKRLGGEDTLLKTKHANIILRIQQLNDMRNGVEVRRKAIETELKSTAAEVYQGMTATSSSQVPRTVAGAFDGDTDQPMRNQGELASTADEDDEDIDPSFENPEAEVDDKAAENAKLRDYASIHPSYPIIVLANGQWYEIACKMCGANARRGPKGCKGFLMGVLGMQGHHRQVHAQSLGLAQVFEQCTQRMVDGDDVSSMRDGKAPKTAVTMTIGSSAVLATSATQASQTTPLTAHALAGPSASEMPTPTSDGITGGHQAQPRYLQGIRSRSLLAAQSTHPSPEPEVDYLAGVSVLNRKRARPHSDEYAAIPRPSASNDLTEYDMYNKVVADATAYGLKEPVHKRARPSAKDKEILALREKIHALERDQGRASLVSSRTSPELNGDGDWMWEELDESVGRCSRDGG